MSWFRIAYRSILHRGLGSFLTMLSMALGVALVVAVLSILGVVEASFRNNSSLGYNLIVGAKGGDEQLTLNTVYYLSRPVENIRDYAFFLEFHPKERRQKELRQSLAYQRTTESAKATHSALWTSSLGGAEGFAQALLADAAAQIEEDLVLEWHRDGKYAPYCKFAIPLCLGDYLGRFRCVATTPEFFNDLVYDIANQRHYKIAQGRAFSGEVTEEADFEAVIGHTTARELNLKLGDEISPLHGSPKGHSHQRKFKIVGILEFSGTPNDRAAFVNMEGFYLMEDHAKPIEDESNLGGEANPLEIVDASDDSTRKREVWDRLPMEQREITSMLVLTKHPFFAQNLQMAVNEGKDARAVFPILVISNLFDFFVRPIQIALLVLTVLICIVSAVSILVSIYNSMNERRSEIAIMRALGASRTAVLMIILLEATLLAVGGGLLGWTIGRGLVVAANPIVEENTGVRIGWFPTEPRVAVRDVLGDSLDSWPRIADAKAPFEVVLLPCLVGLAVFVGIWPGLTAYQTDISKSLGK